MSTDRPLFEQASVVLDGSGNGYATLRPSGEDWSIDYLSVNVSTRVLEATCYIYRGFIGDAYVVDNTISGSTGDTTDTVNNLKDGEAVIAYWIGGDPGARASMNVRGTASNFSAGGFRARS